MPRTLTIAPLDPEPPEDRALRVIVSVGPAAIPGAILNTGWFTTPYGRVFAIGAENALWALGFAGEMSEPDVERDLASRWPDARLVPAPEALAPALHALETDQGEVRVRLSGTDFQIRVWRALLDIPPGQVMSYADLAHRIGKPSALRAVGTAVGQNPVSWAVPCHRVTRKGGALGGYHWGQAIKRMLLAHEGAVLAPLALARF